MLNRNTLAQAPNMHPTEEMLKNLFLVPTPFTWKLRAQLPAGSIDEMHQRHDIK